MNPAGYTRGSSADFDRRVEREIIPAFKRVAGMYGWPEPAVFHDHDRSHKAPRPKLEELQRHVAAGAFDAVILGSLAQAFRSTRELAATLGRWLEAGITVVAIEDGLETVTESGRQSVRFLADRLQAFERALHVEAVTCGLVRRRTTAEGMPWVRQRVVADLEVKTLYESGRNGKWLPVDEIAKTLGISTGRLYRSLRRLRETGNLSEGKRNALAARCGANGAGRPRVELPDVDRQEVARLMADGLGAIRIQKRIGALSGIPISRVKRLLAEVRPS